LIEFFKKKKNTLQIELDANLKQARIASM